MEPSSHIAVVDDHPEIRDLVRRYLVQHGFRVSVAENGAGLRRIMSTGAPDLVVLDVMMPGEDGFQLCRELQASHDLPVIFLTARVDETDRVVGLELGADDYLVKPFSTRELLARIRAVLRRSNALPVQSRVPVGNGQARFGRWTLSFARRELQDEQGMGVSLSTAEFRLLKVLVDRPGVVLTRDQLLDLTVGREAEPFDRSIDKLISRLRKKIEIDPKNPSIIQTYWGGGYNFTTEVTTS